MFEYHGWATLLASANCDDAEQTRNAEKAVVQAIASLVAGEPEVFNRTFDLRVANGLWHLWLAGYHNHRREDVIAIFREVAARAPGSYGILYVYDDEDPEHNNEWIPWVMARGQLTAGSDRFLSPHVGVVEDECP